MNQERIHKVEVDISNKVISNYEREKDKSKKARFKYLKVKADKKEREIKQNDHQLQLNRESLQRKLENKAQADRFRVVLKGLEEHHTKLKTEDEHMALERFYHPK